MKIQYTERISFLLLLSLIDACALCASIRTDFGRYVFSARIITIFCLPRGPAAVYYQIRTGHKARRIRDQQKDRTDNILRQANLA